MVSDNKQTAFLEKLIEDVLKAHDEADLGVAQEALQSAVNEIPEDDRRNIITLVAGKNLEQLLARFHF
ncbi:MAG: hypothetical protein WEC81_00645 [Patescibacteria group bacterium]